MAPHAELLQDERSGCSKGQPDVQIRAYALTRRGHGHADRPAAGCRTRDFAAFLDALGIARAIVVGHSMASTSALRFAIDYPERLSGLVRRPCIDVAISAALLVYA